MWIALEKSLADWDAYLAQRMGRKEPEAFRQADREWVEATLPRIEEEERAVSVRLQKLEELIAKIKMLMTDLDKDLCRKLTGGDEMIAVGSVLVARFGNRVARGYGHGRRILRDSLAEHYDLDAKTARQLFALLEEAGVVRYVMEPNPDLRAFPASHYPQVEMMYGGFYGEPQSTAVSPPLKVFWDIG